MPNAIKLYIWFLMAVTTNVMADTSCWETAMTQTGMNQCAYSNFKKADAELNRVYKTVQKRYKNSPIFLAKLKESQLAWIKLRDADVALKFPAKDPLDAYGSAFPMCNSIFEEQLTQQRIIFLKHWLTDVDEGEICSGSMGLAN